MLCACIDFIYILYQYCIFTVSCILVTILCIGSILYLSCKIVSILPILSILSAYVLILYLTNFCVYTVSY